MLSEGCHLRVLFMKKEIQLYLHWKGNQAFTKKHVKIRGAYYIKTDIPIQKGEYQ